MQLNRISKYTGIGNTKQLKSLILPLKIPAGSKTKELLSFVGVSWVQE
jgi:hypothetical protein